MLLSLLNMYVHIHTLIYVYMNTLLHTYYMYVHYTCYLLLHEKNHPKQQPFIIMHAFVQQVCGLTGTALLHMFLILLRTVG